MIKLGIRGYRVAILHNGFCFLDQFTDFHANRHVYVRLGIPYAWRFQASQLTLDFSTFFLVFFFDKGLGISLL